MPDKVTVGDAVHTYYSGPDYRVTSMMIGKAVKVEAAGVWVEHWLVWNPRALGQDEPSELLLWVCQLFQPGDVEVCGKLAT